MFRLWGKIWKDNRLLKDTVICDDSEDTRTQHGKARFYQDNFIEQIDFDYLEI